MRVVQNKFMYVFIVCLLLLFSATQNALAVEFDDSENRPWGERSEVNSDSGVNGFFINLGLTGARAKLRQDKLNRYPCTNKCLPKRIGLNQLR